VTENNNLGWTGGGTYSHSLLRRMTALDSLYMRATALDLLLHVFPGTASIHDVSLQLGARMLCIKRHKKLFEMCRLAQQQIQQSPMLTLATTVAIFVLVF